MTEQRIEPHKVTKPIQLLAAWLVGLVLTNASFLLAATQISSSGWERGALIISAILNVPLFLLALFVLQTRFRAELQEDTFYADYLSKKTTAVIRIDKNSAQDAKIEALERNLAQLAIHTSAESVMPVLSEKSEKVEGPDWAPWPVALNQHHPRFRDIRESLRSAGIPLAAIFGDSADGPPAKWIVSLSNELPIANKAHLLKAVLKFGFDGIQFWSPHREADEDEDVYIGSYGDGTYARVTDELTELLETQAEAVDLNYYYTRHRVKYVAPRKDD